jgi:hypothetical protein
MYICTDIHVYNDGNSNTDAEAAENSARASTRASSTSSSQHSRNHEQVAIPQLSGTPEQSAGFVHLSHLSGNASIRDRGGLSHADDGIEQEASSDPSTSEKMPKIEQEALDQALSWVSEEVGHDMARRLGRAMKELSIDEHLLCFFDHDSWEMVGVQDPVLRCRLLRRQQHQRVRDRGTSVEGRVRAASDTSASENVRNYEQEAMSRAAGMGTVGGGGGGGGGGWKECALHASSDMSRVSSLGQSGAGEGGTSIGSMESCSAGGDGEAKEGCVELMGSGSPHAKTSSANSGGTLMGAGAFAWKTLCQVLTDSPGGALEEEEASAMMEILVCKYSLLLSYLQRLHRIHKALQQVIACPLRMQRH